MRNPLEKQDLNYLKYLKHWWDQSFLVVLMCIPLIYNNVNAFSCFYAVWISSLANCLFMPLTHFSVIYSFVFYKFKNFFIHLRIVCHLCSKHFPHLKFVFQLCWFRWKIYLIAEILIQSKISIFSLWFLPSRSYLLSVSKLRLNIYHYFLLVLEWLYSFLNILKYLIYQEFISA